MQNHLVTLLTVILTIAAALLVARIISERNDSANRVVSSLTTEETRPDVAAEPEQKRVSLADSADSHNPVRTPETEAESKLALVEVAPEESASATMAQESAETATPEESERAATAPDQVAEEPDRSAKAVDNTAESPDQIATLSAGSDSAAETEQPDKEQPLNLSEAETPEPNTVAQPAEPTLVSTEKRAELTLISVDAPPMDPSLYEPARWHPIHFRPEIESATNEQCLACHSDVLTRKVRETSPAGVKASESLAWYQTLDTYAGDQLRFHQRHMTSPFATQVMDLKCNFCHQGHDPREESPGSSATTPGTETDAFTLRKVVNPSQRCLLCHGKFSYEIMALEGPWPKVRGDLEDPETPELRNGCLTCHSKEGGFRTVRHQVSYLKADAIERLAQEGSSDVCYGCHGGRSWYRISYPYPRHPWPDMDPDVPEWAKDRPTESDPRYALDKQGEK